MDNLVPIDELEADIKHIVNQSLLSKIMQETLTQEEVSDWLSWCREQTNQLKLVKYDLPAEILPLGLSASLTDIKVDGRGPDDKIYHNNQQIRDKVARGNTVLSLFNSSTKETVQDFVIFALRKFTGGMGDEDEEQPENDLVWKKYFLKPVECVERIVVMHKENGEAAHFSARYIDGRFYYIGGSKNVHMIFRTREDIDKYKDSRFLVAKNVCEAVLNFLDGLEVSRRIMLLSFLHYTKLTGIFEILQPSYQHVVDLSSLCGPSLKFLCWAPGYKNTEQTCSLTSIPPHTSLDLGRHFGFESTDYEIIPFSQFENKMAEIRGGRGYEGSVLYFMDKEDNVVGLLKKKTTWYIVLRAIREKVSNAMSAYRKNPGGFKRDACSEHIRKMAKRLDEIQKWLGISDPETKHWKLLGEKYLLWVFDQVVRCRIEEYTSRGRFPQSWKEFLRDTNTEESYNPDTAPSHCGDRDRDEEPPIQLLEPNSLSPSVQILPSPAPSNPHSVVACIVRNLDLVGKNLKKLESIVSKLHQKSCKQKTQGFISLHDLRRIESKEVKVCNQHIENIRIKIGSEEVLGSDIISMVSQGADKTFKSFLSTLSSATVLQQDGQVIAVSPLLTSSVSCINEDTTDLLAIIFSPDREQGLRILESLLVQIYHGKIGNGFGTEKTLCVERVGVIDENGLQELFPTSLNILK